MIPHLRVAVGTVLVLFVMTTAPPCPAHASDRSSARAAPSRSWPDGTDIIPFENLEGVVLVSASARSSGGLDTTGVWVLDTGAGYLALDADLARHAGLVAGSGERGDDIGVTDRPLSRFQIGTLERDQVTPVLTFDARVVRDITDRPVLGLLGQQLYRDRALWLDYQQEVAALIPSPGDDEGDPIARSRAALGPALDPRAVPVRFRLAGDGKALVAARVSDASHAGRSELLTLIVDTGSSKTVLFQHAIADLVRGHERWRSLRGLSAPTLVGSAEARIARVPWIALEPPPGDAARAARADRLPRISGSDVVITDSPLEDQLSRATGTAVHGLLGYSFLRHFRIAIDYPQRVLWLAPVPHDTNQRPDEYSHVGLQLERRGSQATVVAVASRSPAESAGIHPGDVVLAVDGVAIEPGGLLDASRRLEGRPGSTVEITLRRDGQTRELRLKRKRLL